MGITKDCPYTGTIINLTVLGCAVQIKDPHRGRTRAAGSHPLLEASQANSKGRGCPQLVKDVKGFGARFLDLNEEEKDTLEQLVKLFGEPEPAITSESANNPPLISLGLNISATLLSETKTSRHLLRSTSKFPRGLCRPPCGKALPFRTSSFSFRLRLAIGGA